MPSCPKTGQCSWCGPDGTRTLFFIHSFPSDLTTFLCSLRLMESGGRGSITAASKSSFCSTKRVEAPGRSARGITWPEPHSGHCLVPGKEALIPRTRDTRGGTKRRTFPDVELLSPKTEAAPAPAGPPLPSLSTGQFYSWVSWSGTSSSRAGHTVPAHRAWGLDLMPVTRTQALHESISETVTAPVTSGFL